MTDWGHLSCLGTAYGAWIRKMGLDSAFTLIMCETGDGNRFSSWVGGFKIFQWAIDAANGVRQLREINVDMWPRTLRTSSKVYWTGLCEAATVQELVALFYSLRWPLSHFEQVLEAHMIVNFLVCSLWVCEMDNDQVKGLCLFNQELFGPYHFCSWVQNTMVLFNKSLGMVLVCGVKSGQDAMRYHREKLPL